jgi:hypothetical protein
MACFRRITVVLDPLAPEQGAFAHAIDWARRLRLPVRAIGVVPEPAGKAGNRTTAKLEQTPIRQSPDPFPAAWTTEEAYAEVARDCARQGIGWEFFRSEGARVTGIWEELEPDDLFVFGHALALNRKRELFRRAFSNPLFTTLVCPNRWVALSRMLFLDDSPRPNERFLASAAQLARCFGVQPIVLTVARSEKAARQRQQFNQELLAGYGIRADFDSVVGSEVRAAVAHVAQWRRSQLIVMQGRSIPLWWRWLHGHPVERLIGSLASLAVLTLPEAGAPEFPPTPMCTAPASQEPLLFSSSTDGGGRSA